MIKAGGGSVTNISSAYGVVGAPGFAAYCGSKGAVRTFTKSTAIEHAAQGVRANSIHPSVARSEERPVGEECGSKSRFRWSPYPQKTKTNRKIKTETQQ